MTQSKQHTTYLAPARADFDRLLAGEHHDPHSILGRP